MATKSKLEAQNSLILRCQRLVEAFAKSDDERDFYLDRLEGFIIYVDLDKTQPELESLNKELIQNANRYCMIPKLTFYETKKIMEGFVNEKVYDIDTKEKLLDVIQSKEARENFLDFIYDHHSELEKWQQYYQERSRIRIIEWLRNNHFHFVFEEDLDLAKSLIEKLKRDLFDPKAGKDVLAARKILAAKARTYYSNEALNPRPKRGRPPKQAAKLEIEPQVSTDIYTQVPPDVRMFLFTPDYTSSYSVTFSSKFDSEEELLASRRAHAASAQDLSLESLNLKLASLRSMTSKWLEPEAKKTPPPKSILKEVESIDEEDEDEEELDSEATILQDKKINGRKHLPPPAKVKTPPAAPSKKAVLTTSKKPEKAQPKKVIMPVAKGKPVPNVKAKAAPAKLKPKPVAAPKKTPLRSIMKAKPSPKPPTPPAKKAPLRSIVKPAPSKKPAPKPVAKKKVVAPKAKPRRIMKKGK